MISAQSSERVSVIIPVYRAAHLDAALASVVSQSRPAEEVIVIDDGSPDRIVIEDAIARSGLRICLVHQSNQGAAAARNTGLRVATGDLIAFLDADDRWHPHMLEYQLGVLNRSGADVVYADADLVHGSNPSHGRFMAGAPSHGPVTLASLMSQTCTVLMSSVVARRGAIDRVGSFDPRLRRGQDFDLWIRMASAGCRFAFSREVVVTRYVHDSNLSGTQRDELERAADVLTKAIDVLPLDMVHRAVAERRRVQLRGWLAREHGKESLARGDVPSAMRWLAASTRLTPAWKTRAAVLALRLAPDLTLRLYRRRCAQPAAAT
jgi:glycosyltransferase involved in cell wall biosynthesis